MQLLPEFQHTNAILGRVLMVSNRRQAFGNRQWIDVSIERCRRAIGRLRRTSGLGLFCNTVAEDQGWQGSRT